MSTHQDDQPGRKRPEDGGADATVELGRGRATDDTRPLGDTLFEQHAPAPSRPDVPAGTSGAPQEHIGVRAGGPRVATVVWGFVIVALGAAVLAVVLGAQFDVGLAAIVVLAVAGVTLLASSLVAAARRRGTD